MTSRVSFCLHAGMFIVRGYADTQGASVDIWSTGCIFAEMLEGKPLFPGKDHVNQFSIITELLGTPPDDVIQTIASENTLRFVQSLPKREKVPFSTKFPNADPVSLDLLEKMLVFDPRTRISAAEGLAHEYLAPYHDPTDEPVAAEVFDWSFNDADLPVDTWKVMMYSEILGTFTVSLLHIYLRLFALLTFFFFSHFRLSQPRRYFPERSRGARHWRSLGCSC